MSWFQGHCPWCLVKALSPPAGYEFREQDEGMGLYSQVPVSISVGISLDLEKGKESPRGRKIHEDTGKEAKTG